MRKRSGAFHSQTEQQFLMLAQLSHQKTGYFYDEKVHSQVSKQMSKQVGRSSPKQDKNVKFQGFEFTSADIFNQQQLKALKRQNKVILTNIVLLSDKLTEIKVILSEIFPNSDHNEVESPQARKMDLFLAKIKNMEQEQNCIKFWIMEPKQAQNAIYHSYIKRSSRILNFSEESEVGELYAFSRARQILSSLKTF